jgi:hypothetical protein
LSRLTTWRLPGGLRRPAGSGGPARFASYQWLRCAAQVEQACRSHPGTERCHLSPDDPAPINRRQITSPLKALTQLPFLQTVSLAARKMIRT